MLGNLDDISPGALVKWQGGTIGKVVKITIEGAGGRADVQLSSGYQGKLRNDARFAVEKGTPVAVKIIGDTDPVAPPLAKVCFPALPVSASSLGVHSFSRVVSCFSCERDRIASFRGFPYLFVDSPFSNQSKNPPQVCNERPSSKSAQTLPFSLPVILNA